MVSFGLNPNGLMDSTAEMDAVRKQIEQSIAGLDAMVQKYIDANTGEAAAEFVTARQTWQAGLAQMQQALQIGAANLSDINDSYLQGDRRGAALFGGNI
jgi:WXG100 family type VII secretion target